MGPSFVGPFLVCVCVYVCVCLRVHTQGSLAHSTVYTNDVTMM